MNSHEARGRFLVEEQQHQIASIMDRLVALHAELNEISFITGNANIGLACNKMLMAIEAIKEEIHG